MKILQVVDFFSPTRGGGVIAVVYMLSRALAQRGHEVTIYTSDFELDREYIDSLQGVKIHTFHNYHSLNGQPLLVPGVSRGASKELKDFDIIHTHECRSFLNVVLHYYARKFGIPYVVDAHGSAARKSGGKSRWLLDILFAYPVLRDASLVIAETELGAAEYRQAGVEKDRITILYPPFPVEDYSHLPPPGRFRAKFGVEAKHIVLFLGRINRIKGVDFLVESFHELCRGRDDVILAVVGPDDGYKPVLERMLDRLNLSGKVLFTGYLGGEEKQSALVDASMMVLPSLYEQGLPVASLEAVLCDTPIVVSKNTGAGEDALRMNAGYLVQYGDKDALRDIMEHILDNPEEAAANTQRAKAYIMANASMQTKVVEYERLYSAAIQRNGRGKPDQGA